MDAKPLTRKEKIYAIALGLGLIFQTKRNGDADKLMHGLEHLGGLVGEDDKAELKKLCDRGLTEALTQDTNQWPTLDENPKGDDVEEPVPLHEMDHRDAILACAVSMARLAKANSPMHLYRPALRMLRKLVLDSDIEWARKTMEEGMKKCGCEHCKAGLKIKEEIDHINTIDKALGAAIDSLENKKEEHRDDGYDPEDPFRTLSA